MEAFMTAEGQMVPIQSRSMTGQKEDGPGAGWLSCFDSSEVAILAVLVLILAGLVTMAAPGLTSPDKVEAA